MALLKRRSQQPPGGFIYRQSETDMTIKGENEDQLIDKVIAHRVYKGLTPIDREEVRKEIERQICVRLSRLDCKPEGPNDHWVPQDNMREVVTMSGVLAFSKAAIAFLASGGEMAPMEEVQRRAAICRECPMNQPMTGCACNLFYKVLDTTIPADRRVEGMHVCRACNCSLGVKVNLTDKQVIVSNEGRKISWPEQQCWQKSLMASAAAQA